MYRPWFPALLAFALGLWLAVTSFAAPPAPTLVVEAGDHSRTQAPVCVLVDVPEGVQSAILTLPDGATIAGQVTAPGILQDAKDGQRELHFLLPAIGKGESLELKAAFSGAAPEGPAFSWHDTPGESALLQYDGKPVLRYMYAAFDPNNVEETKKVFHHLYDPRGQRLVTKGPGGLFSHHRGLFYGFNRIDYGKGRVDVWHANGGEHQKHVEFLSEEAGPVLGRHCVLIAWNGRDGAAFAREKREMTVYATPGGRLVEFASQLESTVGPVKLDGDPQHAGFQFRASQEVADGDQKLTYYLRVDGQGAPGQTRNWPQNKQMADLPWNAMSFEIGGDRYTAVYLDHPENPKEARYSERTYGRFGSYFEYELDEGKPLDLRYRVWLQDGEMDVDDAQALSDAFVNPPAISVGVK
ncbi:MAG: PmoA family protein [Thermoguttaceae bacterium]|jgi:hypothetical protein|nr:PmoA family protein [Thermoguttaceae bacterium]